MKVNYRDVGTPPTCLIEECSEIIEACSKVIHISCKGERFGWRNYHPEDPDQTTNVDLVKKELKDLKTRIAEFEGWIRIHEERSPR